MANTCTFGVEVSGDPRRLEALKQFVERGVEELPDAKYEKYVLKIDSLFEELTDDDHKFIMLDEGNPCPPNNNEFAEAEGPFRFDALRSRMRFHGTAKWALPRALVERLSRSYPDLDFKFGGTTEHELSEQWTCKGGVSKCQFYVEQDIQADKERWHVRDGQPVRPLEWIDTDQEVFSAPEAKSNDNLQR